MSTYIPKIPREDLVYVDFTDPDPDKRDREGIELRKELIKALKVGNTSKNKYQIIFYSESGVLKVVTTIWMVGENYIGVKGNLVIPINSILDIKL